MKTASLEQRRKRSERSRLYKERKRREAGVKPRQLANPRFDGKLLVAYLDRFITRREAEQEGKTTNGELQILLNGIRLAERDYHMINQLRNGRIQRTTLERVDQLATSYNLPLWEMEEAAARYKKDIRAYRRDKVIRSQQDGKPDPPQHQ